MKDREARDNIEALWKLLVDRNWFFGRVPFKSDTTLWAKVRNLEQCGTRLGTQLENALQFHEKDCPVCGHVTLMKWDAGLMRYDPEASNDGLLVARFQTVRPSGWYCYGCGKTFKESSKTTLEEVKDEG